MVLSGISSRYEVTSVFCEAPANETPAAALGSALISSAAKTVHAARLRFTLALLRAVHIDTPILFEQKINYMTTQSIDNAMGNHSKKSAGGPPFRIILLTRIRNWMIPLQY